LPLFHARHVEYGLVFIRPENRGSNVNRRTQLRSALLAIIVVALLALCSQSALAGSTSVARSARAAHSARAARATPVARSSRASHPAVHASTSHPAVRSSVASTSRTARVHRPLWTPLFPPTHESMVRQNEEVDRLGLPRIQNEEQLDELVASGDLLPITPNETLRIDPRLDPERRFCRSWTLDFVNDLSEAFYREFHDQIQINSAVRTAEVQERLRRHNRNAAAESGDLASSHLAGITVDIQRLGMTMPEIKWVEQYMLPLHEAGAIEPEEERHQRCFHVMVSDRYEDWRNPQSRAGAGSSASASADTNSASTAHPAPAEPVAP
jgi:Family of unknown function (DUF5715)